MNCALNEIAAKSKENPINPSSPYHLSASATPSSSCHSLLLPIILTLWMVGKVNFEKVKPAIWESANIGQMCQSSSFCFCWFVLYCSIETGQPQCCQNHGKCCHGQKDLKLILVLSVGALRPPGGTSLHLGYSWGPTSLVGRANLIIFLRWTMQLWKYLVCSQGMLYCFNLLIKTSDEWLWWWIRKLNGSRLRGLLGGKRHNCKSPSLS